MEENSIMYNRYFGFKENPFSIAPDPRFLYMSEMHQDALAHLNYGLSPESCIILLTGEVGTGKTTICRCFLEKLDQKTDVAVILNPRLSVLELLSAICDEFQIEVNGNRNSLKSHIDSLNLFLLQAHAQDRRCLLVIDEAQNLEPDVLEMVRLLTNLETNQRKLLKVFLFGQSELSDILARPDMTQIDQRITVRFHLRGLELNDIKEYINHRVIVAGGGENRTLFAPGAIKRIHQLTNGIPRLINTICDRSLLGAYSEYHSHVKRAVVNRAGREIFGGGAIKQKPWHLLRILITVSVAAFLIIALSSGEIGEWHRNGPIVSDSWTDQPAPHSFVTSSHSEQAKPAANKVGGSAQLDSIPASTFDNKELDSMVAARQHNTAEDGTGSPNHRGETSSRKYTKISINTMKINN